ncbi:MAG: arsenate reductase (glutaredoxin) [Sulfurovum sp.]
MSKIIIWHNPKCSKSRNVNELLIERNIDAEVFRYLDEPITINELSDILKMLDMKPKELMRQGEEIYKELNLKDEEDEAKLIEVMIANPKLIERPIVIKGNRAVIGRPIENVVELLEAK